MVKKNKQIIITREELIELAKKYRAVDLAKILGVSRYGLYYIFARQGIKYKSIGKRGKQPKVLVVDNDNEENQ